MNIVDHYICTRVTVRCEPDEYAAVMDAICEIDGTQLEITGGNRITFTLEGKCDFEDILDAIKDNLKS